MSNEDASKADDRLKAIEAEVKSLKGKGLVVAFITALVGSGGAAGLTANYWSARNLSLQEKLTASEVALKGVQAAHVALQAEQQRQANQVQELDLSSKRTKAYQESFEARIQAHSLAMGRLKKERQDASQVGSPLRTVEAEDSIRREQEAIREFLRLHGRLVKENPDLPGWYRLGLEQALANLELRAF